MATVAAKLNKYASQQGGVTVDQTLLFPTPMTSLHRAYGAMKQENFKQSSKEAFKQTCQAEGYALSSNIDKILEDPEPKFSHVVKGVENFKTGTRLDWVKDAHEPSHPRYKRRGLPPTGTPQNDKLRVFDEFEKGKIGPDQLKEKLGKDFDKIHPYLKNAEDGKYTKTAQELLLEQTSRVLLNEKPVHNPENFGPLDNPHVEKLVEREAFRKTINKTYHEQKAPGSETCLARKDNGDIVKWTRYGEAFNPKDERYARNMQPHPSDAKMKSQSTWSSDQKLPAPRNRKDFAGSGNIITWLG